MRRRGRIVLQPPSAPPWMVTYADMMNLLLAVFVLMLAFSIVNEKKLGQAVASLQSALGAAPSGGSFLLPEGAPAQPPTATIESAARDLERQLLVMGRDREVQIEYDRSGGLRIVLPNRFLFDAASAEIKQESQPVLQSVGELLAGIPDCFLEVRGHTDTRPLLNHAKFRDNFDLSYARADNVARRIQNYGRFPIEEVEIVACGSGQPVATNSTEAGQQANRRVEIIVRQHGEIGEAGKQLGEGAVSATPPAQAGGARGQ